MPIFDSKPRNTIAIKRVILPTAPSGALLGSSRMDIHRWENEGGADLRSSLTDKRQGVVEISP